LLVDEANKKLELNKKKIKIFYDLIKNLKDWFFFVKIVNKKPCKNNW
jgi:hypothetical protein